MTSKVLQNKRIRTGDKVVVTSGNDRGQVGTVLSRTEDRAIIQGINVCKKHVKKSQANPNGGIVSMERPIHLSKVAFAGANDKPVKLRVKEDKKGQRSLYYREDKEEVAVRAVRKSK